MTDDDEEAEEDVAVAVSSTVEAATAEEEEDDAAAASVVVRGTEEAEGEAADDATAVLDALFGLRPRFIMHEWRHTRGEGGVCECR